MNLTNETKQSNLNQQPVPITGIKKEFENIYNDHACDNPSLDGFLQSHLFFITVRFNLRRPFLERNIDRDILNQFNGTKWGSLLRSGLAERKRTQLSEFGKFYFKISKYLLGNNLGRKRPLQPLTYAFTDFEGSRSGKSDALKSQMPHIHALMLVRPNHLAAFQQLPIFETSKRTKVWFSSIKDIETEPFSPMKGSVEDLASYCMKGCAQTLRDYAGRDDLWAVFPK